LASASARCCATRPAGIVALFGLLYGLPLTAGFLPGSLAAWPPT
jgi:hypothetical protein